MDTYIINRYEGGEEVSKEVTLQEIRYLLIPSKGLPVYGGIICLKEDDSLWLIGHKEAQRILGLPPDVIYQLTWEDDEEYEDKYEEACGDTGFLERLWEA